MQWRKLKMPSDLEKNNRLKKTATIASISLAVSLCLLKTFGALYTGSLSLLSSMIDSLADIFASSITFIAVRISSKPADSEHRYGHGKAEAISALIQSAFVAGSGMFVMYDGIRRLITPTPIEKTGIGILIMLISLIATTVLIAFQKYVTRKTNSQAISADSAHYTVDVVTNLSIILTLIAVEIFHVSWFDTLTAFAVSAYLIYNAYKLARDAVAVLTDCELSSEIRMNIKKIVLNCPFAKGIHDLRTRDLGGAYMFEFHLELDGNLSLYQAHEYTDLVEKEVKKAYPDSQVIIHEDPAGLQEDRLDHKIICENPNDTDCLL